MQKLQVELKNVPIDTPQVYCSTNLMLNKDQSLSALGKVLPCNNPEVDQPQHIEGLKVIVYVISKDGNPLMPCSCAKAKHLLRQGKAKVVKRLPFTIQLHFECENKVQAIALGIDTGYVNIGFSTITAIKELISGTLILDTKTEERLGKRKMYRQLKRRRLWYRKPRFLNRLKSVGWLPPSIQRRYDTHLTLINKIKKILPISKIILEVAKFDIQKIMNPEIQGKEYQQGNLYDYQNTRSYLMTREHGKCQLCGKDFKGQPSHIHHCRQRNESGSNRVENLAILHKTCHDKLHRQGLKLSKPKSYKPNTFMSIINKRFRHDIPELSITYGYETFIKRNDLGLEKSHNNDAFVIANGITQERAKPFNIIQKHRNNRILQIQRKDGIRIRKQRYKIQPLDLFWVKGKQYTSKGMFHNGKQLYSTDKKKRYFGIKKVEKYFNQGSLVWNL